MSKQVIGIVDRPGSFSDRWISYCEATSLDFVRVDPYSNNVIQQLSQLSALVWHIPHFSPRDELIARHILYSCQMMGVATFPSLDTFWSFDDKVAQKYILEASGCQLVPTYVFVDQEAALAWAESATFPKVFKLKCGAGSRNVSLVKTKSDALAKIRKAFSTGFSASAGNVSDAAGKIRSGKIGATEVFAKLKRLPRTLANLRQINRLQPRQIGYVYFQEFIPNNTHDTRVTVIGDRAIAFRRAVRKNDFRASGSGSIDYDQSEIDHDCISQSFQLAQALKSQSLCIDFVTGKNGKPLVVEISYVYMPKCIHQAGGYWTTDMQYHETPVWPQEAILDDLISSLLPPDKTG